MGTLKDILLILIGVLSIVGITYITLIALDNEAERYFNNQMGVSYDDTNK